MIIKVKIVGWPFLVELVDGTAAYVAPDDFIGYLWKGKRKKFGDGRVMYYYFNGKEADINVIRRKAEEIISKELVYSIEITSSGRMGMEGEEEVEETERW